MLSPGLICVDVDMIQKFTGSGERWARGIMSVRHIQVVCGIEARQWCRDRDNRQEHARTYR